MYLKNIHSIYVPEYVFSSTIRAFVPCVSAHKVLYHITHPLLGINGDGLNEFFVQRQVLPRQPASLLEISLLVLLPNKKKGSVNYEGAGKLGSRRIVGE